MKTYRKTYYEVCRDNGSYRLIDDFDDVLGALKGIIKSQDDGKKWADEVGTEYKPEPFIVVIVFWSKEYTDESAFVSETTERKLVFSVDQTRELVDQLRSTL